jgi:hypothetical protein
VASRSSSYGNAWTGWIGFAGVFMIVVGGINFCEGLIAVIRGGYFFHATPDNIIIFDSTAWGVIMMLWGALLAFAGRALLSGASWGRWLAIVAAALNFVVQLSFAGSSDYPLWSLAGLALSAIVIYALTVRWNEAVGP